MASRKENKKTDLIKCIDLFLFVCGAFMLIYNYSMKVRLNEDNNLKIEEFLENIVFALSDIACFCSSEISRFFGLRNDIHFLGTVKV